jgi:hypothetical protein
VLREACGLRLVLIRLVSFPDDVRCVDVDNLAPDYAKCDIVIHRKDFVDFCSVGGFHGLGCFGCFPADKKTFARDLIFRKRFFIFSSFPLIPQGKKLASVRNSQAFCGWFGQVRYRHPSDKCAVILLIRLPVGIVFPVRLHRAGLDGACRPFLIIFVPDGRE